MPATPDTAALRPSDPSPQDLSALLDAAPGLTAQGPVGGVVVTGCTHDSRAVRAGDLYAALPGAHAHGATYADEAVAAGAVAVLTDPVGATQVASLPGPAVPMLVAAVPRSVLGQVASRVHGDPSAALTVLGDRKSVV